MKKEWGEEEGEDPRGSLSLSLVTGGQKDKLQASFEEVRKQRGRNTLISNKTSLDYPVGNNNRFREHSFRLLGLGFVWVVGLARDMVKSSR